MRPADPGESKRLTDIGGKSGHHAVIVGQARGAGYLGDMQGFALPFALTVIAVIVSVFRIWLGPDFPFALSMIGGWSALLAIGFGVFLSVVMTRNAATSNMLFRITRARLTRRRQLWER